MTSGKIGLADAIDDLRKELSEAIRRGQGEGLRFTWEKIDLEIAVEIAREAGGDGKVSFNVLGSGVELGGKGGQTSTNAHRITLTLKPAPGTTTLVSDEVAQQPK